VQALSVLASQSALRAHPVLSEHSQCLRLWV